MAANRTHLRRIARVHQNHWNACASGLVLNLIPQIIERPVRVSCPLLASDRYPIPYPAQIFERNTSIGVLCLLHDLLGNDVVGVALKTSLLTRNAFELALGRFRAIALEIAAEVKKLAPIIFNRLTAVGMPVTIRGDVHNAKVNAE